MKRATLTWLAVLLLVLVVSSIFAQMAGPWPIVAGAILIGGAIFLVAGAVLIGVAITSTQRNALAAQQAALEALKGSGRQG